MILPIVAYGDPILRKVGKDIDQNYPEFKQLLENMWETMYKAEGVGLAAPQIGKDIRLFVVDTAPFSQDEDLDDDERAFLATFKKVFINATIINEEGKEWAFTEGCLSIPNIREDVNRKEEVTIKYLDEHFIQQTEVLNGLAARVVQHEYDHIEGILFTDKLSSLKKRLLKKKLANISKGLVEADYKMKFTNLK